MHPLGERPQARKVEAACPVPCSACPWRTENHGKPHPDGWYTAKNRERLWAKLRRGEAMTCHPTDPANPIPAGAKPVPEGATTHECAGALVLQQREIEKAGGYVKLQDYFKENKRGLTKQGVLVLAERLAFGGTFGGLAMTSTNLNEPVSHPPLGEWDGEAARAASEKAAAARRPKR